MALLAGLLVAAALLAVLPSRVTSVRTARPRTGRVLLRGAVPLTVVAGVSAAVAVLLLVPAPVGLLLAAPVGFATGRGVGRLEPATVRRRRARLEADLPLVVDLVAVGLESGLAPPAALAHVAAAMPDPTGQELGAFVSRLALGADPETVWAELARHDQWGPLGRTLLRSARTGASVAGALGRLADEVRAGARAAGEARARTIEVKASVPLGLCLLPSFVLIGIVPLVAGSWSRTFLGLVP